MSAPRSFKGLLAGAACAVLGLAAAVVSVCLLLSLGSALRPELAARSQAAALAAAAEWGAVPEPQRPAWLAERAKREGWAAFALSRDAGPADAAGASAQDGHPLRAFVRGWADGLARVPVDGGALRVTASMGSVDAVLGQALGTTLLGFGLSAVLLAGGLAWIARRMLRPIDDFAGQAQAAAQRVFAEMPLPAMQEWERLSRAMNLMVQRVRIMLAERETELATIQEKNRNDALTRAVSREYFITRLSSELTRAGGALVVVHALDIEGLNRRRGWRQTDDFLIACAAAIRIRLHMLFAENDFVLARLNGADFALLLPGMPLERLDTVASGLHEALLPLANQDLTDVRRVTAIGATLFRAGETASEVLSKADAVLGRALLQARSHAVSDGTERFLSLGLQQWGALIESALARGAVRIDLVPVLDAGGEVVHLEARPLLMTAANEELHAHEFEAPAARTGRVLDLNLRVLELALIALAERPAQRIGACIDERSLERPIFLRQLGKILAQHPPELLARLDIEVAVAEHSTAEVPHLQDLVELLAGRGMRVGVARLGLVVNTLPLTRWEVDYLKLSPEAVRGIARSDRRSRFVAMLCDLARGQGLAPMSGGPLEEADRQRFFALGGQGVEDPSAAAPAESRRAAPHARLDRSPRSTTEFGALTD